MKATVVPVRPHDLVSVSYIVPAGLAVALQAEIDGLLARVAAAEIGKTFDLSTWDSRSFTAPFHANYRGDEDAWTLPSISETDIKPVCWAVDNWTDTGRSLAAAILNHPDGMHSRDLADLVGYSGGIPSAFRALAGRLRAIDRAPFWFGDADSRGHERGQILSARPQSIPYQVVRSVFGARYPKLLNS